MEWAIIFFSIFLFVAIALGAAYAHAEHETKMKTFYNAINQKIGEMQNSNRLIHQEMESLKVSVKSLTSNDTHNLKNIEKINNDFKNLEIKMASTQNEVKLVKSELTNIKYRL